jgi:hypothetical protein
MKKVKTLQESAKELKDAVDRLHEAKKAFINTYAESLFRVHWCDRQMGNTDEYFKSKFGDKLTGGYRQPMQ